ncbi:small ribosomal subunit protein bS21c-like [Magnolia sinica]|uniref:small ribosomal subunit protein bS21c-like n=1 Tax=Magnolia sinica TaxID=86752 RepID=UPI00265A5D5B|nr:small ribosomal subunit protein bS21c-like [Magnolia sinica]
MAISSCNFLQLPFSKTLPPSPSAPSRRSSSLSFSPIRSSKSETPFSLIKTIDSSNIDPIHAVDPSLKYANILFFRSAYNVQIVVDEDEPEEVLLRRFRREVSKAGVIQECKRRRFFENKQEEKKRKNREASRRNRRRRWVPRFPSSADADAAANKARSAEDAEDNWEMPEGNIPF